ncbi:hypothetical protein [Pedobacter yulinensis]|nr:hypothetical protein [Pedobacter yulinensis]
METNRGFEYGESATPEENKHGNAARVPGDSEEVEKGVGYGAPGEGSGVSVPADEGIPAEEAIDSLDGDTESSDKPETDPDSRESAI